MPTTPRKAYRLDAETLALIELHRGGQSATAYLIALVRADAQRRQETPRSLSGTNPRPFQKKATQGNTGGASTGAKPFGMPPSAKDRQPLRRVQVDPIPKKGGKS